MLSAGTAVLLNVYILREISGACVDTKLRHFEGTYIVSGGRGQPQASTESDRHCGTERSGL